MSGNHILRVDLQCKSLDTQLAEQETTRFYGEDRIRSAERLPDDPAPMSRIVPQQNQDEFAPLEPTPLEGLQEPNDS